MAQELRVARIIANSNQTLHLDFRCHLQFDETDRDVISKGSEDGAKMVRYSLRPTTPPEMTLR